METTFKAGVIGCGGRGRSHARGYQMSPDVDIVACFPTLLKTHETPLLSSLRCRTPTRTIRRC